MFRLSKLGLAVALFVCSLAAVMVCATQNALAIDLFGDNCKGSGSSSSACPQGSGENNISGPNGVLLRVVGIISIIGSITAVITVMVGGFLLITAGGDSGRLSSGRKTIIFALIGLVIMATARPLLSFVINRF